jgi:hypothetical protein
MHCVGPGAVPQISSGPQFCSAKELRIHCFGDRRTSKINTTLPAAFEVQERIKFKCSRGVYLCSYLGVLKDVCPYM